MKSFLTQPKVQYFILSSLILPFLGGVTSQNVVIDKYTGPDPVSVGDQVHFTGTVTHTAQPTGVSFFIRTTNVPPDIRICNMFFGVCDSTLNSECYCSNSNSASNTYDFVIQTIATLERSQGTVNANIAGNTQTFPRVIAPTQRPPTTGTSTGSTDVTNDNVTFTTVTTGGPTNTTETTPDDGCCDSIWIIVGSVGGFVVIAFVVILIYVCWWKKKKCAAVTSDQPSDSPAEEASTVHSNNHNALTSSKPEDKVEMTGEKKKKKSKKSTKAGSPKKKKKDFENGEKKMDENEPRCLPQPEPVAEPGLSTSLSNPEALKSNFATTRLSSPPSNTRPTSIEMTSAPRPLPSPRNPNM